MQRSNPKVEKFYKSRAWKETRKNFIIYSKGICNRCHVRPGNYVHHKIYITADNVDDPNIALNYDNLELLCFECHQQEHFPKQISYDFDDEGNLIPPL